MCPHFLPHNKINKYTFACLFLKKTLFGPKSQQSKRRTLCERLELLQSCCLRHSCPQLSHLNTATMFQCHMKLPAEGSLNRAMSATFWWWGIMKNACLYKPGRDHQKSSSCGGELKTAAFTSVCNEGWWPGAAWSAARRQRWGGEPQTHTCWVNRGLNCFCGHSGRGGGGGGVHCWTQNERKPMDDFV